VAIFLLCESLFFCSRLQAGETPLEVVANHVVHGGEDAHQLAGNEGEGAVHDPGYASGGVAFGLKNEVGGVVALEGFEEVELDGDLGGVDDTHLHAAFADLAVAFPFVDRAYATGRAGECGLHSGIELCPGRPCIPVVKIVDEGDDLFGRGVDGDGALDYEGRGLHGSQDEYDDDSYDGEAADPFKHLSSLSACLGDAYSSHLIKPTGRIGRTGELRRLENLMTASGILRR
jgi:hypothetical protein